MDSEVAELMPNNLQQQQQLLSPTDTGELRRYMQRHAVLGDRVNLPEQLPGKTLKPRVDELHFRQGTGRVPQAKRFCIRIKRPEGPAVPAQQLFELDPEELKDALLQQALAQRQALVAGTLRAGTGRVPPRPEFNIRVKPPQWPQPALELDVEPEPPQAMAATQLGQAKTPADSAVAQYPSPIEGVPERLSGRRGQQAAPAPSDVRMAGAGGGATLVGSNQHQDGDGDHDSPVEGLVQQQAGNKLQPQPADAPGGFAFHPPPRPDAAFASPPARGEMGVQTGASLNGSAAKDPAALGTAFDDGGGDDDDDFGGGGFDGGFDDWGGGEDAGEADHSAGPPSMPPPPPKARRYVRNPGIRLRNENPRKSMAVDPLIGRQEVEPGIRRSMRRHQGPLMWWLGEKKNFDRNEHKTMPTVATVTTKLPNTPWRTVADPREWRRGRRKGKGKRKAAAEAEAAGSDDGGGEAPASPADSEETELMRPLEGEMDSAKEEAGGSGGDSAEQQAQEEVEIVELLDDEEEEAGGGGELGAESAEEEAPGHPAASAGGGLAAAGAREAPGDEEDPDAAALFAPATAPIDDLEGETLLEEEEEGGEIEEAAAAAGGGDQPSTSAAAARHGKGRKKRKKAERR